MKNFTYYAPTRIIFGRNTHKQIGEVISGYGFKKILLHYGTASIKKNGVYDEVIKSLRENAIEFVELGGVKPNPELSLVNVGIKLCRESGVDLVLAVGGGSAIDSSKLIAVGAKNDCDPWLFPSKERLPADALPVAVILTMAASGSEMSSSCVITNENGWLKRGYQNDFNRPLFSICNPELTFTVPPFQTACGVVDIFMHTAERYFSAGSDSEVTDRIAEGLMKSVLESGSAVLKTPHDYNTRANLMWAGTLSHNDLTGLGRDFFMTVHQIEHEISGMYTDVAHGAGLSVIFPAWAKYVYKKDLTRFTQFAVRVMNCEMNFDHPEQTALEGITRIEKYFQSIKAPTTLEEIGINDDSRFEELAEKCTFFGKRKLTGKVNLDKADIISILKLCRAANR